MEQGKGVGPRGPRHLLREYVSSTYDGAATAMKSQLYGQHLACQCG